MDFLVAGFDMLIAPLSMWPGIFQVSAFTVLKTES
jgi:hypothetical protein